MLVEARLGGWKEHPPRGLCAGSVVWTYRRLDRLPTKHNFDRDSLLREPPHHCLLRRRSENHAIADRRGKAEGNSGGHRARESGEPIVHHACVVRQPGRGREAERGGADEQHGEVSRGGGAFPAGNTRRRGQRVRTPRATRGEGSTLPLATSPARSTQALSTNLPSLI